MKAVKTISDLGSVLSQRKGTVGFVPTMGALHDGHISLVRRCRAENDTVVVSIFVNPTQFNDKSDLKNYPRTPEHDMNLLQKAGTDIVFIPEVEEMYPEPDTRVFDFGPLGEVMEGANRPGHFNGVAQIVSKLFDAVRPVRAYFGEKDFQQLAIIRELVRQNGNGIDVVGCPIERAEDGLALSSRNALLTPAQREAAPEIFRTLQQAVTLASGLTVSELTEWVGERIAGIPELELEYFTVANADTLQPSASWAEPGHKQGFIVVRAGNVRLIDNINFC